MSEIQRITDRMKNATDLEGFWKIAHEELEQYGVSGIFYGQLASAAEVTTPEKNGGLAIPTGLLSKCSYSTSFLNAFSTSDLLENDPTVTHCLESNEVLAWGYDEDWGASHPWYRARYEIEKDLGYHKGCTIPSSHFSDNWIGGMGIAMTEVPDKDFDLLWANKQREIIAICSLLDAGMRSVHSERFIALSPREKECLTWLAAGLSPQQIAHKLRLSLGRVDRVIGQAKRKLNSTTRDHAVVRALLLGVIQP